jgi:hypothetical protein
MDGVSLRTLDDIPMISWNRHKPPAFLWGLWHWLHDMFAHEVAAGRSLVRRLLRFVGSLGVGFFQDIPGPEIQDDPGWFWKSKEFGSDGWMVHDGHEKIIKNGCTWALN